MYEPKGHIVCVLSHLKRDRIATQAICSFTKPNLAHAVDNTKLYGYTKATAGVKASSMLSLAMRTSAQFEALRVLNLAIRRLSFAVRVQNENRFV